MRLLVVLFVTTSLLQRSNAVANRGYGIFADTDKYDVYNFGGATTVQHRSPGAKQAVIYCYPGSKRGLSYFFTTIKFNVIIDNDDYRMYSGGTPPEVYSKFAAESYGWNINPFRGQQPRSLQVDLFNSTCLAVDTKQAPYIELQIKGVDVWRLLALLVGLGLFFSSRELSGNPVFFYLCGVAVGVCASFMVLVYYVSKLCPQKMLTYGVLLGGWTVGVYVFQQLWSNMSALAFTYQTQLFWYTLVVGMLSFAACYRIGPPRDRRSMNLVMWTLQVIGLLLVFFCSEMQEVTTAIIIVSLVIQYFPETPRNWFRSYWLRKFPPKRRLLTNEEYYEQGARETKNALDDLRKHCASPDCAQWRIMLKLNDSKRNLNTSLPPRSKWQRPDRRDPNTSLPSRSEWQPPDHRNLNTSPPPRSKWQPPGHRNNNTSPPRSEWQPPSRRFASFVEGESHLSDDEILDYETSLQQNISSDESSNTSEDEY